MIKINDKIVYRNGVCTITDIAKKYKDDEDYYVLTCFHDPSLLIRVPVSKSLEVMRPLITKDEIKALIQRIHTIPVVPIGNGNRGLEYKELLSNGSHESLITIIKTAYLRQQANAEHRQKTNESDKIYFRQAERLFYNEIAASLNICYNEAKEYIIKEVTALTTDNANKVS